MSSSEGGGGKSTSDSNSPAAYPTICPVLRGGGGGNVVSLLDAMRLTVMQQTAKGLPRTIQDEEETYPLRDPVVRALERLTWSLWHGAPRGASLKWMENPTFHRI
jgi:hypothetical protein